MKFKLRLILCTLLLGGVSLSVCAKDVSAEAPNNELAEKLDMLTKYINDGQYSTARKYIVEEKLPPVAVSEVLKTPAVAGDTPSMWMLAEQYYLLNRFQDSADWTYTAFLGTRIDAKLCENQTASGLERNIISAFNDTVQKARQDPLVMQSAITFAIDTQRNISKEKRDATWICSMVKQNSQDMFILPSKRDYVIDEEISNFEKVSNRNNR